MTDDLDKIVHELGSVIACLNTGALKMLPENPKQQRALNFYQRNLKRLSKIRDRIDRLNSDTKDLEK